MTLSLLPTVKLMCSVNMGFQNNDGGARYQLDSTFVDGEKGNF